MPQCILESRHKCIAWLFSVLREKLSKRLGKCFLYIVHYSLS